MVQKIAGFTAEVLSKTEIINGFQLISKSDIGFEIVDRRDLKTKIYNPIKGVGVKRTFSATHYIVTKKYYNKLINIPYVA